MRIVVPAIALAAVLLVCGCGGLPSDFNCDKLPKNMNKDECLYNKSMIQVSSVGCRDIMNESMKANCIDTIALRLLDYLPCKQHDKKAMKDKCEGKVSDARKKAREANPDIRLP